MKKMAFVGVAVASREERKAKRETKRRIVPVLSESRKKLFAAIETSPEFGAVAFYVRYSNIKKAIKSC